MFIGFADVLFNVAAYFAEIYYDLVSFGDVEHERALHTFHDKSGRVRPRQQKPKSSVPFKPSKIRLEYLPPPLAERSPLVRPGVPFALYLLDSILA